MLHPILPTIVTENNRAAVKKKNKGEGGEREGKGKEDQTHF